MKILFLSSFLCGSFSSPILPSLLLSLQNLFLFLSFLFSPSSLSHLSLFPSLSRSFSLLLFPSSLLIALPPFLYLTLFRSLSLSYDRSPSLSRSLSFPLSLLQQKYLSRGEICSPSPLSFSIFPLSLSFLPSSSPLPLLLSLSLSLASLSLFLSLSISLTLSNDLSISHHPLLSSSFVSLARWNFSSFARGRSTSLSASPRPCPLSPLFVRHPSCFLMHISLSTTREEESSLCLDSLRKGEKREQWRAYTMTK